MADASVKDTEQETISQAVRPKVVPKAFPTKILQYTMTKEHPSDLRRHRHTKNKRNKEKISVLCQSFIILF